MVCMQPSSVAGESGFLTTGHNAYAYYSTNSFTTMLQGMNFIAGCLLLFMEEEDAFWCLTTIVEQLLSGYFSTTMAASQVQQLLIRASIKSYLYTNPKSQETA